MKIKAIFAVAVFVAFFGISKAQQGQPEVRTDGFRGPVRSVTTTMYEAITENNTMRRGDVLEKLQTIYNYKGQRKSMTYLSAAEDIIFRSRYKHDAFGQTTLEQIVDNEERVIGRTYYIYNSNFVLTETYVEDQERQIENRTMYKYDGEGRLSQRSFNDPQNEVYRREVYTYTADGNILKTVIYNRARQKIQEVRYEYDEHGQAITRTLFDYTEAEPEVFITRFNYRYDSQNNWIQKTEYNVDGDNMVAEYITERKLEYFE